MITYQSPCAKVSRPSEGGVSVDIVEPVRERMPDLKVEDIFEELLAVVEGYLAAEKNGLVMALAHEVTATSKNILAGDCKRQRAADLESALGDGQAAGPAGWIHADLSLRSIRTLRRADGRTKVSGSC